MQRVLIIGQCDHTRMHILAAIAMEAQYVSPELRGKVITMSQPATSEACSTKQRTKHSLGLGTHFWMPDDTI